MTLILYKSNLKPMSRFKDINNLTINDFFLVNTNCLGYATSILFIDEVTKLTRTIR
jgi:hypothetical protein